MFETWYVKGVPFVNKRCMKGVPFLSKMVYKRVRGWTAGRSLPLRFFNEYSSPRVSSVFTHSGIRAYLRTKNNSNHNSRVYSGYTNDRAIVACKTGALWAKRGERGILREARDEGRGGEKKKGLLPVHCSGSSHVHCMNLAFQLVDWWRVVLACLSGTKYPSRIHVLLTMLFEKPFVYFRMFQK